MLDTVERLFATTRIQLPESSRDMVLSRVILVCDWSPKPVDLLFRHKRDRWWYSAAVRSADCESTVDEAASTELSVGLDAIAADKRGR
jgi:hypothetical protein